MNCEMRKRTYQEGNATFISIFTLCKNDLVLLKLTFIKPSKASGIHRNKVLLLFVILQAGLRPVPGSSLRLRYKNINPTLLLGPA